MPLGSVISIVLAACLSFLLFLATLLLAALLLLPALLPFLRLWWCTDVTEVLVPLLRNRGDVLSIIQTHKLVKVSAIH